MQESPAATPLPAHDTALRELQAAREIAHAFLTARSPDEVYRLALERVAPVVGAAFGCVYLRESSDVLRLVAAWNWPAAYRKFLGDMRVRVGLGPTGRAVQDNQFVEIYDVFRDESLHDWWDAAHELGFASTVSLPIVLDDRPEGALTFYFRRTERLDEADRSLLRLVADQLSATAEKAHLIEDLQRANLQLREQNVELEARFQVAEEARRLKNEFMANISHELRTPLTAILGFTYLLREGHDGALTEQQAQSVDRVESSASVLMALIDDLLSLANLQLGRLEVHPETCDAVALARAALDGLPEPAPGVELRTLAPDAAVPVRTDGAQVVRILRQILGNALKFTPAGTVTVRVRVSSGSPWTPRARAGGDAPNSVVWEVEDTGIGIDEQDLEPIFDAFRQVDGSVTRRYGGTGMGLALSRQLARRLGGDVTVRSRPGQGSTFTLSLPAGFAPVLVG